MQLFWLQLAFRWQFIGGGGGCRGGANIQSRTQTNFERLHTNIVGSQ